MIRVTTEIDIQTVNDKNPRLVFTELTLKISSHPTDPALLLIHSPTGHAYAVKSSELKSACDNVDSLTRYF